MEGLPAAFRAKIVRALRDYDIDGPRARPGARGSGLPAVPGAAADGEPGPGRHRAAGALAERRRHSVGCPRSDVGEVLDRLIVATQLRYPVIGDVARNLRFRFFDEPLIARGPRAASTTPCATACSYLAEHPDAPDYAARIEALVATPGAADRAAGRTHHRPGPRRCSRSSPGGTTRSAPWRTSRPSTRRAAVRHRRPTSWPASSCTWSRRSPTGRDLPAALVLSTGSPRRDPGGPGRRHLPVLAGRARRRRRAVRRLA